MRHRVAIAVLFAFATAALPASATEEAPDWRKVDAATGQIVDIAGLEQLARDFPDSASVRLRLLNAYLEADRSAEALREAVALVRRGYLFGAGARQALAALGPTEEQARWLASQESPAEPIEGSDVVAEIPVEAQLVESVWLTMRGDMFATTVVSRALFVRRGHGAWEKLPIAGAGSLTGLVEDPASGRLWMASGVFDQTPDPRSAFRGLIAIDPLTGAVVRRVAAPQDGTPSDIAVDAAGRVYASDPLSGAIYRASPDSDRLEVLVAPGTFRSPQGLAVRGDRLILSDYRYGLASIELPTGRVARIGNRTSAMLDGIDGVWLDGSRLIAIQNGLQPMRIVELILSRDSLEVVEARTREAAVPAWSEPLSGTQIGTGLIYVATGQWDAFGPGGAVVEGASPKPTVVRVLPSVELQPPPP